MIVLAGQSVLGMVSCFSARAEYRPVTTTSKANSRTTGRLAGRKRDSRLIRLPQSQHSPVPGVARASQDHAHRTIGIVPEPTLTFVNMGVIVSTILIKSDRPWGGHNVTNPTRAPLPREILELNEQIRLQCFELAGPMAFPPDLTM